MQPMHSFWGMDFCLVTAAISAGGEAGRSCRTGSWRRRGYSRAGVIVGPCLIAPVYSIYHAQVIGYESVLGLTVQV